MASLSELAEESARAEDPIETEQYYDDEDRMFEDLFDGVALLKQSKTLLSFLSDRDLCKSITVRERAVMVRMTERLTDYLEKVTPAILERV